MRALFPLRAILGVALIVFGIEAGSASAQTASADPQGYHQAYLYALRCVAANSAAESRDDLNPGGRNKAIFDAAGQRAFDAVLKLGRLQGYDNARLNHDIDALGHAEIARMASDDAYFQRTRSDCIKLGLN